MAKSKFLAYRGQHVTESQRLKLREASRIETTEREKGLKESRKQSRGT